MDSKPGYGAMFWFELDIAPTPEIFDVDYDNTGDEENEKTNRQ